MKSDYLISFKNVYKRYDIGDEPTTVIKNASFNIHKNAFTIIYGPSGSGKTTIINMILGLLEPTSGTVEVAGVDMFSMNANQRAKFRSKNFGTVYQTNNWIKSLDTAENVALPMYLSGSDRPEAMKSAEESLMRVGMEQYKDYYPTMLSIGQQQRVSMARATVTTPILLVADEPTGNLDTENGDLIMKLIASYKQSENSTVILITHNLDYLPLSDHRLFIRDGVVKEIQGGYSSKINEQEDTPEEKVEKKEPASKQKPSKGKKR